MKQRVALLFKYKLDSPCSMVEVQELLERVKSSGSAGIKKTDLRREFGEELESTLEQCVTKGLIYTEKRAGAYYCWHQEHYVQSLLNSDPRFRLTYDLIKSLEERVISATSDVSQNLEQLAKNISNLSSLVAKRSDYAEQPRERSTRASMPLSQFKERFDSILGEHSSSIGWVELGKIRNQFCERYSITGEEFYSLVGSLSSQFQDKYELSTGGGEGVMIRGLLHGFVRCI